MSNIRVAESAGFCFGVKRAIEMAYEAIGVEPKLYSYGQLIHNKTVTDDLASKGLEIVENLDGLTEGTLLIRSHGVGKALYDEAEAKGLKILDGTCPFVKKIHHHCWRWHTSGSHWYQWLVRKYRCDSGG